MKRKFNTTWTTISTSLLAFTSIANADVDNSQMRNLENRVSALEQRRGASGVINPPARPQIKDGADLFISGDLLVWQARENGLPVAIVNKGSTPSANLSKSHVKNFDFDWNVGFRVAAGYNVPHDGWDLSLTWLRFYTNGHSRTHAHSNQAIFPTRVHPRDPVVAGGTCTKAHAHWKLHLNQLDLDMGREFFVSKWLTIRPHFGLRSDWINQKAKIDYDNFTTGDVEVEQKDRWWGIGLEGGIDTQWGLGGGWSIFGDLGAAILYGFHKMHIENEDEPTDVNFVKMKDSYHISHPILDLELGLRWDRMFSNDRFHIRLQGGWEHHVYFSQNQFPVFVDDVDMGTIVSNQGDLTFQGWTFSARFDF
ncbi:MAG: Lpg1974 family pore-forming outer membrane protein [Chlamydiota bacterium]